MIFDFPIIKNGKMPLYLQLYKNLRGSIRDGRLEAGARIPAIREMKEITGLSRTTIENAYQQLMMEGYIESRHKVGYFVLPLEIAEPPSPDFLVSEDQESYRREGKRVRNAGIDPNSFDFSLWRKLLAQVLREENKELNRSGDVTGEMVLKQQLRDQLRRDRGVNCSPDQIVIGAGVQVLLGMLLPMLPKEMRRVGVEDPGFVKAQYVFEDYGWEIVKIPLVDGGIDVKQLKETKSRLAYVSPSHQYPTGTVMPVAKREDLLRWAEEEQGLIVEDDYDSYLRYAGNPIPALQGMDQGDRVIYLGSFSKLLLPALRISYMILPRPLLRAFQEKKYRLTPSASKLDQLTLARFMQEGHYERHLRRIRKIYRKKNLLLTEFLAKKAGDLVSVLGIESGVHLVLEIKREVSLDQIMKKARAKGIDLERIGSVRSAHQRLLFPYSGIALAEMNGVQKDLLEILKGSESDDGANERAESSGDRESKDSKTGK